MGAACSLSGAAMERSFSTWEPMPPSMPCRSRRACRCPRGTRPGLRNAYQAGLKWDQYGVVDNGQRFLVLEPEQPDRHCTQFAVKGSRLMLRIASSRPLLVHRKGRMLHSGRFPEHCRTPPGNPPRSWSTALTKAFPVIALSAALCPSPGRKIGGGRGAATVPIRTENYHDYRSLGFVP